MKKFVQHSARTRFGMPVAAGVLVFLGVITVLKLGPGPLSLMNADAAVSAEQQRSDRIQGRPAIDGKWAEVGDAPIIGHGATFSGAVWNDPCVIKEGSTYRMWLSGGNIGSDPRKVRIFEAKSSDGMNWNIGQNVELDTGPAGSWDSMGVETPAVVRVGSTYHMYYTGYVNQPTFDIGHATSTDGVHWRKDPANPVLRRPSPNQWGWVTVAEPGVVYYNGTFYLYHTRVRCREYANGNCAGPDPKPEWGISLATSKDGSSFRLSQESPVLTQSSSYPASKGYGGYSTPAAVVIDGVFHLYYDVMRLMGRDDYRQVAIAHATSPDGIHFTEVAPDVLTSGTKSWTGFELRAPWVIVDNNELKMWYAGNNANNPRARNFRIGIGLARLGGAGTMAAASPVATQSVPSQDAAAAAGAEEVANGNMEDGGGNTVANWSVPPGMASAGKMTWSSSEAHGGRGGMRLVAKEKRRPFMYFQPLTDPSLPGSTVELSAWVKSNRPGQEVSVRFSWSGSSQSFVSLVDQPPRDADWHFYTKTISIPRNATEIVVVCYVGPNGGDGSFDDVSVKRVNQ